MNRAGADMTAKTLPGVETFPIAGPRELPPRLAELARRIKGRIFTDRMHRIIYASDSSSYREFPLGIVVPEGIEDLRTIVRYAGEHGIPLVPRGAGTSLAGPGGRRRTGRRPPDVRPDPRSRRRGADRARRARRHPRTAQRLARTPRPVCSGRRPSTTNRAVVGGMVGNNSCGMHSLIWGSTRDHLVSCKAILADGSDVVFEALSPEAFHAKRQLPTLEGRVYDDLYRRLSDPATRREIEAGFPKPEITRRNNGYAVDLLLRSNVFTPGRARLQPVQAGVRIRGHAVPGHRGDAAPGAEAAAGHRPGDDALQRLDRVDEGDAGRAQAQADGLRADRRLPRAAGAANNKVNPNNSSASAAAGSRASRETVIVVEFAGDQPRGSRNPGQRDGGRRSRVSAWATRGRCGSVTTATRSGRCAGRWAASTARARRRQVVRPDRGLRDRPVRTCPSTSPSWKRCSPAPACSSPSRRTSAPASCTPSSSSIRRPAKGAASIAGSSTTWPAWSSRSAARSPASTATAGCAASSCPRWSARPTTGSAAT